MPEEAIAESANVLNTLTASAPALGAVAIIVVIFIIAFIHLQRSQNQFICKMQKRQEVREDKVIDFVANYATTMQADHDLSNDVCKAITELNRDCRDRFERMRDSGG